MDGRQGIKVSMWRRGRGAPIEGISQPGIVPYLLSSKQAVEEVDHKRDLRMRRM
jgi:hypothetical protein